MPLVIPVGCYQASFVHINETTARLAVITQGFIYSGSDFAADALEVEDAYGDLIMPMVSTQWILNEVNWRVADGTVRSSPWTRPGGSASAAATPNVCYLIRKTSTVPGRHGSGRWYLPGVAEVEVSPSGQISTAIKGDLQTGCNALQVRWEAASMNPCILHNDSTAPTPISNYAVDARVATQRRRLR